MEVGDHGARSCGFSVFFVEAYGAPEFHFGRLSGDDILDYIFWARIKGRDEVGEGVTNGNVSMGWTSASS